MPLQYKKSIFSIYLFNNLLHYNFQIIKTLYVEKERFSTVPGFEPESFDCRSNALSN